MCFHCGILGQEPYRKRKVQEAAVCLSFFCKVTATSQVTKYHQRWDQKWGLPAWRSLMGAKDRAGTLWEVPAVETCANNPGPLKPPQEKRAYSSLCQSRCVFSSKWGLSLWRKHAVPPPHHVTRMVTQQPAVTDAVVCLWLFRESQTAAFSFTSWNWK